jgi:hypothetical protein
MMAIRLDNASNGVIGMRGSKLFMLSGERLLIPRRSVISLFTCFETLIIFAGLAMICVIVSTMCILRFSKEPETTCRVLARWELDEEL